MEAEEAAGGFLKLKTEALNLFFNKRQLERGLGWNLLAPGRIAPPKPCWNVEASKEGRRDL